MRIQADNSDVAAALWRTHAIITANDGFVAEDFTVHEARGQFWCSVGAQPGIPGRLLVSYSHDLQVPMDDVEWDGSASSLIPASGVDGLSSIHRELLDAWLQTVNLTNRLSHVIEVLPSFAIRARGLRRCLADGGFPWMRRDPPGLDQAKDVVVRWHSSGGRNDRTNASGTDPHQPLARLRRGRLIPLKNLVNHHPNGADQSPIPNRTAVITAGNSDANQTYECYGERDAFQLLMHHGYVEQQAPLVHSVPVEVAVPGVGRVRVLSMPRRHSDARTRAMRRHGRPQPPEIVVRDGSWNIRSMTFRPRTRSTSAALLGLAVHSHTGLSGADSRALADQMIDAILTANDDYYRRLHDLAVLERPNTAADSIVAVAQLQRIKLNRMWGAP